MAAEAKVLEERERTGKEELNEGAHKANKHYKPWENPMPNTSATILGGDASIAGKKEKAADSATSAGVNGASNSSAGNPKVSAPSDLKYLGIPYSDIIAKWWQMYNDGQEPVRSNRNTLTFELAVNLRHICGFDRNLMAQVIPSTKSMQLLALIVEHALEFAQQEQSLRVNSPNKKTVAIATVFFCCLLFWMHRTSCLFSGKGNVSSAHFRESRHPACGISLPQHLPALLQDNPFPLKCVPELPG